MDDIFLSVSSNYVVVCLNNINVLSKKVDERLEFVDTVLPLLQNAKLTIKMKKFVFMDESIEHIGHIVKPKETSSAPM